MCMYISVSVDCKVSNWEEWTVPDEGGNIMRSRVVMQPSLNGGRACPDMTDNEKGM